MISLIKKSVYVLSFGAMTLGICLWLFWNCLPIWAPSFVISYSPFVSPIYRSLTYDDFENDVPKWKDGINKFVNCDVGELSDYINKEVSSIDSAEEFASRGAKLDMVCYEIADVKKTSLLLPTPS